MKSRFKKSEGSVTVEAAIVLPVFLCAVLTIGFLIRIFYVQEIIQHAMTETVNEMSTYSYIYYKSGLYDLQKGMEQGLEEEAQIISHLDDTMQSLNAARTALAEDVEALKKHLSVKNYPQAIDILFNSAYVIKGAQEQVADLVKVTEGLDLNSLLGLLANGAWREVKASTGGFFALTLMEKHLVTASTTNLNQRLLKLNIVNGVEGLDFSDSKLLEGNHDIELCVEYKIALPLPINIIGPITVKQRAAARAWLDGDMSNSSAPGEGEFPEELADEVVEAGYDIWSLPVFKRGREIKRLLGTNVDENFPIVDKFDKGTITSIRSHDTRLVSNKGSSFIRQLNEDLRRILEYRERSFKGVTIGPGDYNKKELNLVFPDIGLEQTQIDAIYELIETAHSKGIKIKITVVR